MANDRERASEARLEELREEARRTGNVAAGGPPISGGPLPAARTGAGPASDAGATRGYYGLPMLKAPVWTWEVPLYFFTGGLAGMSALIGAAALALVSGADGRHLARGAFWIAAGGSVVSAALLVSDLGRPARFLNMLRVFKWRSAMSAGAWILAAFGASAAPAAVLAEWSARAPEGFPGLARILLSALAAIAAVLGSVLATYTGVLIGATAVPAWRSHRTLLPAHFGIAGLGSAAALLELAGFRLGALHALGLVAAAAETGVGVIAELHRHGAADRALRTGRAGALLRAAGILSGPLALGLRIGGLVPAAGVSFLAGSLISRFGWLEAGKQSARDPEAALWRG